VLSFEVFTDGRGAFSLGWEHAKLHRREPQTPKPNHYEHRQPPFAHAHRNVMAGRS